MEEGLFKKKPTLKNRKNTPSLPRITSLPPNKNTRSFSKGYSFVELMVAIAIIVILAIFAMPNVISSMMDSYRRFTLYENYSNAEYLIQAAKIMAMENTKNIAVCVSSNQLALVGTTNRSSSVCSDPSSSTLRTLSIQQPISFANDIQSFSSFGNIMFDPRGMLVNGGGSVCVYSQNLNFSYQICVSPFGGIRNTSYQGACMPCSG